MSMKIDLRYILLLALCSGALAQSPAENTLLQLANQVRALHSVPPLQWDPALAGAARFHNQWVIREPGELLHQYPGEPDLASRAAQAKASFSTISENIARRAQNPGQLQQVWMSTAVHRGNLLDPNLNAVGISVLEDHGLLYAVEDFAHTAPAQRADTIEGRLSQLLLAHGLAPAASNDDAQKTCELPQGNAGSPKLVIQWDGPDPTQLPDVLLQQIATGRYTSAQVGACATHQPNPQFATYHVAVLLY